MTNTEAHHRCGMTLTELLVVIAILGLLMVTAIPVLVPNDERAGREAALTFTSAIARAKARAKRIDPVLGKAGITFAAIQDDVASPNAMRLKAADLFTAEVPPPYPVPAATAHIYELRLNPFIDGGQPLSPRRFRVIIDRGPPLDMTIYNRLFPSHLNHRVIADGSTYLFRQITPPTSGLSPSRVIPPSPTNETPLPNHRNEYPIDYLARRDLLALDPPIDRGYDPTIIAIPPGGINGDKATGGDGNGILLGEVTALPGSLGHVITSNVGFEDPTDPSQWGTTIQFEQPLRRAASPPLSLPGSIVVDLTWSCLNSQLFCHSPPTDPTYSDSPLTFQPNGARLTGSSGMTCLPHFAAFRDSSPTLVRGAGEEMQSVHVIFNAEGQVDRVEYPRNDGTGVYYSKRSLVPGDVLCFLLGRADRAGNGWVSDPQTTPGANWQYADSRWVSIQQNGNVTISNTRIDATTVVVAMEDAIAGIRASRY